MESFILHKYFYNAMFHFQTIKVLQALVTIGI